jgi:hypothetical protein
MKGKDFCCYHEPTMKERGQLARSLGGINSHGDHSQLSDNPTYPLKSAQDVAAFLEVVINSTHQGRLDAKTATALGTLSSSLAKVLSDIKDAEIESRLEELRRLAASRPTILRNGQSPYLALTNNEMPSTIKLNEPEDD